MSDLAQTLARLSAILGPPDGEPVALDGGITNRNYRVDFGGSTYVIREPGKDTELLGIDRGAEWAASLCGRKGWCRALGASDAREPARPRDRVPRRDGSRG